jgi:hypothetical protein
VEDILKKVVAVLRADAALATMTGATAKDSRVYLFYRADADLGPSIPGYVTVSLQGESASGAVVSPSYTIAVWARSQDKLEPMGARVRALLHKQTLTTATGRKFYSKQVTASDRFQPQSNFSSKTLQYTAGWLEIAGALSTTVSESVGAH